MQTIATIVGLVGGVAGLIFYFVNEQKRKWVALISLLLIISTGIYFFSNFGSPRLEIINPLPNNSVQGALAKDGQLYTIVTVRYRGDLMDNEKIVLFAKVSGGNEWYVTSNPIEKIGLDDNGIGNFGYASFGAPNDGNSIYDLLAIVTTKDYITGQKVTRPEYKNNEFTRATIIKDNMKLTRQ